MIYLDTSVALALIFNEPHQRERNFWDNYFVSSRLLQYELWNRLHTRQATGHRHQRAISILHRVRLIEMTPDVLVRALHPFDQAVRTLDSLHLATMVHLKDTGEFVEIATFDNRLLAAAAALGVPAARLLSH